MDKVLIEVSNGTITNVRSTNNNISIYIIDHDTEEDGYPSEVIEEIYEKPIDYYGDTLSNEKFHEMLDEIITEAKQRIEEDS